MKIFFFFLNGTKVSVPDLKLERHFYLMEYYIIFVYNILFEGLYHVMVGVEKVGMWLFF